MYGQLNSNSALMWPLPVLEHFSSLYGHVYSTYVSYVASFSTSVLLHFKHCMASFTRLFICDLSIYNDRRI